MLGSQAGPGQRRGATAGCHRVRGKGLCFSGPPTFSIQKLEIIVSPLFQVVRGSTEAQRLMPGKPAMNPV